MRKITIITALLATLLFAGCLDLFDVSSESGEPGTLSVTFGGEERTLAPSSSGLTYLVSVYSGTSPNFDLAFSGVANGSLTHTISSGRYTVRGEAYDGDILVAMKEKQVDVLPGLITRVNLTLLPVFSSDVPGAFAFKVEMPQTISKNSGITSTNINRLRLSPVYGPNYTDYSNPGYPNINDIPEIIELTDVNEGTLALPPGLYLLTIELISNRFSAQTQLNVIREELVYIYSGQTTYAQYIITNDDFIAQIHLSGDVSGAISLPEAYTAENREVIIFYNNNIYSGSDTDNYYYIGQGGTGVFTQSYYYTDIPAGTAGNINNSKYWAVSETGGIIVNMNSSKSIWETFFNSVFIFSNHYNTNNIGTPVGYSSAKVRYKASDEAGNFLIGPLNTITFSNPYGSTNETGKTLYIEHTTMSLRRFNKTDPSSRAYTPYSLEATLQPHVARGGWTTFTVTNPVNHALIFDSIHTVYVNHESANNYDGYSGTPGSGYGIGRPTFISQVVDGARTIGINIAGGTSSYSGTYPYVALSMETFALNGGKIDMLHYSGSTPVKIEAYEGDNAAAYPVKIGEAVPAEDDDTAVNPDLYHWNIPFPAGYIWKDSSANCYLVVTIDDDTDDPDNALYTKVVQVSIYDGSGNLNFNGNITITPSP
ncbi:MAG: hypothetical protein FWC03_06780 [Treponema sp.]|nr:hypothetical protein [Treponema sp.]